MNKYIYDNANQHHKILKRVADKLKNNFLEAGIGISGSVARHTQSTQSDIDLLLLDNSLEKNRQYIFYSLENIRVNILCLNPIYIERQLKPWSLYFTGQHLQYILDTISLYDPSAIIEKTQERIFSFKKNRISLKDINELLLNFIKTQNFKDGVSPRFNSKKKSFINLYSLLNSWFILQGVKSKNKTELLNAFKIIEKNDSHLFQAISDYLTNNTILGEKTLTENFSRLGITYPIQKK